MSELVVYYGPGTVRSNDLGADLSEFANMSLTLPAPETVSISQLKDWFTVNFSLDPKICTVSIQSVWSKSISNTFWELKTINRTSQWVSWLNACKRRSTIPVALVLPVAKENPSPEGHGGEYSGQGSQPTDDMDVSGSDNLIHTGGSYEIGQNSHSEGDTGYGEADDAEEDEELQNQMEDEDLDGMEDNLDSNEEEGEDNEEEMPIPGAWNQDISTVMRVPDGDTSGWEYSENNIEIGAMYGTKKS